MIYSTYVLIRIVETDNVSNYRFIWDDEYELTNPRSWEGWFRGVTGGYNENGEYERYDTRDGSGRFGNDGTVATRFVAMGGTIEPYAPPEE